MIFQSGWYCDAVLKGANLKKADLREAILVGADLRKANLHRVNVLESDWIEKLKEWEVGGHEEIKDKYFAVDSGETTRAKQIIYELELKEN